jgi:hypothetical protein
MGIEPTPSAWKAEVLPLNYTRPVSRRAPEPSSTDPIHRLFTTDFSCSFRFPRGGGGRIRTFEGVSRQIYSLLPLTAWVPHREKRAAYSDFRSRECQFDLARSLLRLAPQLPQDREQRLPLSLYRGSRAGFPLNPVHQPDRKLPPLAGAQVGRQLDRAIAHPGQPQDLVANRQPEAANLPVTPFAQDHAKTSVESRVRPDASTGWGPGHRLDAIEPGRPVVQSHPRTQALQRCVGRPALYGNEVFPLHLAGGVHEPMGELAIRREKQ